MSSRMILGYGGSTILLALGGLLVASSTALCADSETLAGSRSEASAAGEGTERSAVDLTISARVNVIGSPAGLEDIVGSAYVIGQKELEESQYTDIHRILQQIPGINLQEEDGYGLRPNIGMRGTGVERSQKITLMEDGVLIAPAPYAAPAAYYFPTTGRMVGVEVRKGSAAIRQGPYTNGGALNLISAAIPGTWSVNLGAALGSNDTQRLQALVGDTRSRFGWMLQGFHLSTDGFKRLDDGGDTGTTVDDYVGKLRFSSDASSQVQQSLELKLGLTEQDGNETYLGLTSADFSADPFRRYVGSSLDKITTFHEQVQLRHFVKPAASFDVTTTLYNNNYSRDWFKNESVAGVSNRAILSYPELYSQRLRILRGEIDSEPGALHLRHNSRKYFSRGVDTVLGFTPERLSSHFFEVGVRHHEDEEDRFQQADLYQMLDGGLVLSEIGAPGSNSNRVGDARATAIYVQDRFRSGRFSVTSGVRWESIRHRRFDYSRSDPDRSAGPYRVRQNHLSVLIPGVGMAYELSSSHRLFAGAHKGFSPPGTGSTEEVDSEESLNLELGYRFRAGLLHADVTAFSSDYDNLLGVETVSGGGATSGDLFNGGAVKVKGLEASMGQRWQVGEGVVPLRVAYTYTQSEFQTSFLTSFADWSPEVQEGDRLPYIPEHQLHLMVGYERGAWSGNLKMNYMAKMRTTAGQGLILASESTDERTVFDMGAQWSGLERTSFYMQLRNVLDETFLVSRRPYGVRPGLDRTLLGGASFRF